MREPGGARGQLCRAVREGGPLPSELHELAFRHGVLGLFPEALTPHLTAELQTRALLGARQAQASIAALHAEGIPAVALKGAVAGARAWADPLLRPQSDVDLLVPRPRRLRAIEVLQREGLAGELKIPGIHAHAAMLGSARAAPLGLDLHLELSSNLPLSLQAPELIARAVTVQSVAGPLAALAPEDDAVYLALHAANHGLGRLAWLVDLRGLFRAGLDASLAAARAEAAGAALPVRLAWEAVGAWLGVPEATAAADRIHVSPARLRAARLLLHAALRLGDEHGDPAGMALRTLYVPSAKLPEWWRRKWPGRAEEQAWFDRWVAANR